MKTIFTALAIALLSSPAWANPPVAIAGAAAGAAATGGESSSGGNDQTTKTHAYALAPASPHTSDRGAALPQAFGLFTLPHEWQSARRDADLAAIESFSSAVGAFGDKPGSSLTPAQLGVLNAFAKLSPEWCATMRGLPDWGGFVAACD